MRTDHLAVRVPRDAEHGRLVWLLDLLTHPPAVFFLVVAHLVTGTCSSEPTFEQLWLLMPARLKTYLDALGARADGKFPSIGGPLAVGRRMVDAQDHQRRFPLVGGFGERPHECVAVMSAGHNLVGHGRPVDAAHCHVMLVPGAAGAQAGRQVGRWADD